MRIALFGLLLVVALLTSCRNTAETRVKVPPGSQVMPSQSTKQETNKAYISSTVFHVPMGVRDTKSWFDNELRGQNFKTAGDGEEY